MTREEFDKRMAIGQERAKNDQSKPAVEVMDTIIESFLSPTGEEQNSSVFHRIAEVIPMENYLLKIRFLEGVTKIYDVKSLFDIWESFSVLKDPDLFRSVSVDRDGYGIIWNDDLDLSCNELFENGQNT